MNTNKSGELIEDLLLVPCVITVESRELLVGINAHKILSIVEYKKLSLLPSSHFPFIGIYNNNQQAVPVLNLSKILEHPVHSIATDQQDHIDKNNNQPELPTINFNPANNDKIAICHLCDMVVGILVQATYRIETIKSEQIVAVPKIFENHPNCMFNGLHYYKDKFLYLLDLEGILERLNLFTPSGSNDQESCISDNKLIGKTVLIAEDSKVFRHQITKFLSAQGLKCIIAKDGKEGLDKFLATPNDIDIIISDIEMPYMNGIEMIRHIREVAPNIPVLFNSSISNPSLIAEIKKRHGCFLVKFNPEEVLRNITHYLNE